MASKPHKRPAARKSATPHTTTKRVAKALVSRNPPIPPDLKKVGTIKVRTAMHPIGGEPFAKGKEAASRKVRAQSVSRHLFFTELMDADDSQRVELVRQGLRSQVITETADALAVPKTTLLSAIGVPVSTITRRMKSHAKLSPDESDKIDRVAQTFKRAIELFGDDATAREWMSTKLLALGDRTPLELLDSSAGYEMVLNTIGRIAYGAAA